MLGIQQQKSLAKVLSVGLFLVSVTVVTSGLTDPVNVPKLLLLGVLAMGILGMLGSFNPRLLTYGDLQTKIALCTFLLFSGVSIAISNSPLTQNIYGAYGRNNGFLAYLYLSILFFTATLINTRSNHLIILKSLVYVGFVNLAYCLWVIAFGDFISWDNPYGNILGTFGNPNFIGAFFGMFFGVLLALGSGSDATKNFRISLIFLLPLTLFAIIDSQAIQGRVLAALSVGIVGIFLVYFRYSRLITLLFIIFCTTLGSFALAGAFQKGPLAEIIYQTSVSLRGQYWLAAWNTGQANPFSGVGMDAFGDWYRRSRDDRAIELPGVNTVVNTAHNVPLDMFAFGGWPLFVSYMAIMVTALLALIRIVRRMKSYDAVGVGLITAWTCYQVQSIISINQIGLAIWGWVLSGCLIAYSRVVPGNDERSKESSTSSKRQQSRKPEATPTSVLFASVFGLVGLLVSLPPVSADTKLRTAQVSSDAMKLEETMKYSYFNPQNSQKYLLNIQAFEGSGLFELSHKYALEAVSWNPEAYELWRILYFVKNSSDSERTLAVENMRRLDPLNPDVTSIR
jgi:hypothetical protein